MLIGALIACHTKSHGLDNEVIDLCAEMNSIIQERLEKVKIYYCISARSYLITSFNCDLIQDVFFFNNFAIFLETTYFLYLHLIQL